MIIQVTCDATQSRIAEESVISLEILVKIAFFYYQHLLDYMDQAIVPVSYKALVWYLCSPDIAYTNNSGLFKQNF